MQTRRLRIAITGATGLLGRNLLFEFIKQNIQRLDDLEILVLGRSRDNVTIEERMRRIIIEDGAQYLSATDPDIIARVHDYAANGIEYIHGDLDENGLDIDPDDVGKLRGGTIDHFFHVAALTDFRDTPNVVNALKRTNVYGVRQILDLISTLKIGTFHYVGTAYACGNTFGQLSPDYINTNQKFRNPYELTKLEAEILVREYADRTGVNCCFFRPSTICGRLIEPPPGSINKFDVFYFWAAFFLRMKLREMGEYKNEYDDPCNLDVRVLYNDKSGLNIVPADYAAKAMYQVCMNNGHGKSYHIVNDAETRHGLYISSMLSAINVTGVKRVDKVPEDMNRLEALYYKTVGKVFTPYITAEPMLFDTTNLQGILKTSGLTCPVVDNKNFSVLMDYAREHDFGLVIRDNVTEGINR